MPEKRWEAWLPTWCRAVGDLIAFQAKRFAIGAWFILVIVLIIAFTRQQQIINQTHKLASQSRELTKQNRELTKQNTLRLHEIQQSRVHSCQETYRSYFKVFKPFFPPDKAQTPKQRDDKKKFIRIVNSLIQKCPLQTKPKKG